MEINEETEEEEKEESVGEDYLFNYHRSKLAFGLILFEMDDAIKEGDGRQLHDLYKFALLIYRQKKQKKKKRKKVWEKIISSIIIGLN